MSTKIKTVAIVHLTRRARFSAAHKLWREDWTQEENDATFGKCSNPNWHGHNYVLFVTVKGEMNPDTGFVVDLRGLSVVIKKEVIDHVDHKNLNLDTPFMKGKMTSTEALAVAFWEVLTPHMPALNCQLHSIKITETENNSVEYYGE